MKNDEQVNQKLKKIFDKMNLTYSDRSVRWEEPFEGKVVKVHDTPTVKKVFIKTEEPFKEGDKVTGRHGEKGIVSKILPDDEMPNSVDPETGEQKAVDMIVDPHGVPSRANPGQLLEIAAGKVAKKTGEQYRVKNFEAGALDKVKNELKKHGLSDKEDLVDPMTGKKIPGVATGYAYKAKLKHQLDKKFKARDLFGEGYDSNEQPVGGAAVDNLTLHALAGHNARANMSEMARLKGTRNQEYWEDMVVGNSPKKVAHSPYSFKKMEAMMGALGMNVQRNKDAELELSPMTDKEVMRRSKGAVDDPGGFKSSKNSGLRPLEGSLFDPGLVGVKGRNWNHIDLGEPVPNPLFGKAIGMLLQEGAGTGDEDKEVRILKDKEGKSKSIRQMAFSDVEKVFTGDRALEINGEARHGGEAIKEALQTVDLDKTIENVKGRLQDHLSKGEDKINSSKANNLHMALRYAQTLKEKGVAPEEGYMMSKAPVLPAQFRKPMEKRDGKLITPSTNKLYAGLIAESNYMKKLRDQGQDMEGHQTPEAKEQRKNLYNAFGALLGATGKRPVGNFEGTPIADEIASPRILAGDAQFDFEDTDAKGPKGGFAQKNVVKKKQELSGRTTIIPDPNLDVDTVGLPEEAAWKMYEPFVRSKMSKDHDPIRAKQEFEERSPMAKSYLKKEMRKRPVMTNRAPSWWQYNIMAFEPKLVETDPENPAAEKALKVPNLVVNSYFGGDFDGDTMSIHVPSEDAAVREAWKMTPSNHLQAPGSKKMMQVPDMSMLLGLNLMSGWKRKSTTKKISDPRKAYRKGEVGIDEVVKSGGQTTTAGWEILDKRVREATNGSVSIDDLLDKLGKRRQGFSFDKGTTKEMLRMLLKDYRDSYSDIVSALSREGDVAATSEGFSVGVSDLTPMNDLVKKETQRADKLIPDLAKQIADEKGEGKVTDMHTEEAKTTLYASPDPIDVNGTEHDSAAAGIEREIQRLGDSKEADSNSLLKMMGVGSKGNKTQIRQVLGAPLMIQDVQKNVNPNPIMNSYSQGLNTSEYYVQQAGALSGLRDRSVETSRPGDIGKQIVAASSNLIITEKDCGTDKGVWLDTETKSEEIVDRVLAKPAGGYPAGTVVTSDKLAQITRPKRVYVRSPLTCEAEEGLCQQCFGLKETGSMPSMGENVGIREGQAIVEASTKMTLKSFHTTGSADKSTGGFDRFEEVINLKTPAVKAEIVKIPGEGEDATATVRAVENKSTRAGTTARIVSMKSEGGQSLSFRIPPGRRLRSKTKQPGSTFTNGEKLTWGDPDPKDVAEVGGFRGVQNYITDEMHKIIGDVGGINRRTAETAVTAMSGTGTVVDPGSSDFNPRDQVRVGKLKGFNREREDRVTASQIPGRTLSEDVDIKPGRRLKKGHQVSADEAQEIREVLGGQKQFKVDRDPIQFQQDLQPVRKVPRLGSDWLPKMNFRHVKKEMIDSGIRGDKSPIHGSHPISAYMYGGEMDEGQNENNWKY